MMRFFVHYTVYYTSLAFFLLLLLLLITGDRTKNGPLGFIGLDFYERLTRGVGRCRRSGLSPYTVPQLTE